MSPPTDSPLQLADLWAMLVRRRRVAGLVAVAITIGVFVLASVTSPTLYRAEATLTLLRGLKPVSFGNDPAPALVPEQMVNTQRELLTSKDVLEAALVMGGLTANPAYAGAADPLSLLQRRLRTNVVRNSWVIAVTFDDEDPVRAETGLQSVLDAYLAHQATLARASSAEDLSFVETQLAEAAAKLLAARNLERVFRTEHSIASTDPDRNHITARIQTLAERQAIIDERLAASSALFRQVRAADAIEDRQQRMSAYLRIDTISTATVVGTLQKDLFALEGQEAELSAKYLDKHPRLIEVRSHIAAKRAQLEETITGARASIEADVALLTEQRAELAHAQERLRVDLNRYLEYLVDLQRLSLESQALQKVHDELQARQAQLTAIASYDERKMSIDGRPRSAVMPKRLGNGPLAILALLAAIAAGVSAAAVADSVDRTVRDGRQLRVTTGLPLFASLPAVAGVTGLRNSGPAEPARLAEAMRGLWTALRYAAPGDGCRIILVTSPDAGDGRTTLAARLAAGAALAGARILLVDADLRRPCQATQFGEDRPVGLVDLLAGVPELAPSPTFIPNLDLMTAGRTPANPGELLNSHWLAEWLAHCRAHYDAVILDAPALADCADALVLAGHSDLTLLLVRCGHSRIDHLSDAILLLAPVQAQLKAVLLDSQAQADHVVG